ncbi:hypothetical protein Rmet_6529 [Cupriavidus metallidurans CH34]|uniref:Uncharacterized protein n=1 Tax=Cupriavidus metallidurans (strain ATCC 43123 / DSM 2839 / NBRC 102507 / CH34) TaxID=266264 RepID=D3DXW6_CUPMC|nr:hypothetical protein Rmet_6529 [Cupriavidus metallidurans CH34]
MARGHAGASGGHWHPRTAAEVIRCIAVTVAQPAGDRLLSLPLPVRNKSLRQPAFSVTTALVLRPSLHIPYFEHSY